MGEIKQDCVDTAVLMHYIDSSETHWGMTKWQLHKNATRCFEQIQLTTPHKIAAVWLLTAHLKVRQTRHVGHCSWSKDKLISDVILNTCKCQCWPSSKNLYTSALSRHGVLSRGPIKVNVRLGRMVREG